jgi:hypothetical protein
MKMTYGFTENKKALCKHTARSAIMFTEGFRISVSPDSARIIQKQHFVKK